MNSFRHLKVSCIIDCIRPLVASGNIQKQFYSALAEYSYVHNTTLTVKTYCSLSGELAQLGDTHTCISIGEVLADDHFQQSDLIFYSFSGYDELLPTLQFAPKRALKVILFHGITRPNLYFEQREHLEQGYDQTILLNEANKIFVCSDYIASEVRGLGVSPANIHKIPLLPQPAIVGDVPLREAAFSKIRLTFLSRFCSAKGIIHLFEALEQWADHNWTLDIIFNSNYSDMGLVKKYHQKSEKIWGNQIHWHPTVDDDKKNDILAHTDIFIMPSLHEGFCIPIIEALAHGCGLVHSDAGSIPEIAGELGLEYRAGDVEQFVEALEQGVIERRKGNYATNSGVLSAEEWIIRARAHVEKYTFESFKNTIGDIIFANLPPKRNNIDELLAEQRVTTLNAIGLHSRAFPEVPQFMTNMLTEALKEFIEPNSDNDATSTQGTPASTESASRKPD